MNLTDEELQALKAYFEETNINMTKLSGKIGSKGVINLSKAIDKILDYNER